MEETIKLLFCKGCEEMVDELFNDHGYKLCSDCNEKYDNKTGYCSLNCCLGGGCDQTC